MQNMTVALTPTVSAKRLKEKLMSEIRGTAGASLLKDAPPKRVLTGRVLLMPSSSTGPPRTGSGRPAGTGFHLEDFFSFLAALFSFSVLVGFFFSSFLISLFFAMQAPPLSYPSILPNLRPLFNYSGPNHSKGRPVKGRSKDNGTEVLRIKNPVSALTHLAPFVSVSYSNSCKYQSIRGDRDQAATL